MTALCQLAKFYHAAGNAVEKALAFWLPGLLARLVFAATLYFYFLNSALTKVGPGFAGFFMVRDSAYYQIALPAVDAAGGDISQVPFFWHIAVHLGTYAEFLLPLMLLLGILTRLSAIGMAIFIMVQTIVDITVHQVDTQTIGALFDRFPDAVILDQRLLWLFPLVYLVIYGPGLISLDGLAHRACHRQNKTAPPVREAPSGQSS